MDCLEESLFLCLSVTASTLDDIFIDPQAMNFAVDGEIDYPETINESVVGSDHADTLRIDWRPL